MRDPFLLLGTLLLVLSPNDVVGECPPDNVGDVVLVPHESDCTRFYRCIGGIPELLECPSGLHFNPTLQACDYPAAAGCDDTSIIPSSSPSPDPVDPPVSEKCPPDNVGDVVLVPHESDCTRFYRCIGGIPELLECPSGLHFNPTLQVCDYPAAAGCDDTSIIPSSSPSPGPVDPPVSDKCPPDNVGDVVLVPHESDCTRFYRCIGGILELLECPSGLHFNPTLQVCDYPDAAGCDDTSIIPSSPPPPDPVDPPVSDKCPPDNVGDVVLVPHEYDCTRFYRCIGGIPELLECPSGLHFNPTLQICDYPDAAGCDDTSIIPSSPPPPDPVDPPVSDKCPPDNVGDVVLVPHESDCTRFYRCIGGIPELLECPSGLHFNPTLQVCDYPDAAGCDDTSIIPSSPPPPDPVDPPVSDKCPPDNVGDVVLVPHEYDCTRFYRCIGGIPELLECPSGLHFNPTLQVCDYPAAAGCDDTSIIPSSSPSPDPVDPPVSEKCPPDNVGDVVLVPHESDCTRFYSCIGGIPELLECPSGLHFNPTLQVCDYSAAAGCDDTSIIPSSSPSPDPVDPPVSEKCPPDNVGDVVLVPHESDCTRFYRCIGGIPELLECPSGLHFNPMLQVCDYPDAAGCDDTSIIPSSPPPPDPVDPPVSDKCPPDNVGDVVLVPHEYDCTRFYRCIGGIPELLECPSGLHFNPTLQVCDYPDAAGCDDTSIIPPSPPPPDPVDPPVSDKCPPDNVGDVVLVPHESDCTRFYRCIGGILELLECPSGLHFNPTLQICDYPDAAGCDDTSIIPSSPPPPDPVDPPVSDKCPPDNVGDVVLVPHEYDCTRFYRCIGGIPELLECPSGLHFNPTLQVCDYPAAAGCDDTSIIPSSSPSPDPVDPPVSEKCPPDNVGDVVLVSHESDCTRFYRCIGGIPELLECPSGLHFNPTLQACDYPAAAGCDDTSIIPSSPPPPDSVDPPVSEKCPPDNAGDGVPLPHESDCTHYIICVGGVPWVFKCPAGLHFNPTLQACDYPAAAGCDDTSIIPSSPPPPDSVDPPVSEKCPPDNAGDGVPLPHESDCTHYIICVGGVPWVFKCPAGSHFNPTLLNCDHPDVAGCNDV